MSFARYSATVPAGAPSRVWMGPLKNQHGMEMHTREDWAALIETLKVRPVRYDNLRRVATPGSGS